MASWQSQIGFAARLQHIQAITEAYQSAHPECTVSAAQLQATDTENAALEEASSAEEYGLRAYDGDEDGDAGDDDGHDDELDTVPTKSIGPYKRAHYHREGISSVVYRARSPRDGSLVALKCTTPATMRPPHDSLREARILGSLRHSHVIRLLESFREVGGLHADDVTTASTFVLAFPFYPHQLDQLWHAMSAAQIRARLREVFSALAYIHAAPHGVVHRDIKPSNILLSSPDGPAVLADFGIAWSPHDSACVASEPADRKITDVGTGAYRAPELLFGDAAYDASLDMWAAGCVVAEAMRPHHETLFDSGPLGSELGLVSSIFSTLGTPNADTVWPSATRLPDWGKMQFKEYPPRPWGEILKDVDASITVGVVSTAEGRSERFGELCDLMRRLVCYEQTRRLTAAQVRQGQAVEQASPSCEDMTDVRLRQALEHPFLAAQ
ncbi:hypothetical protein KEM52_003471 [Ascosphaera acerosa]|nr:hypothetical protein KEM52_003471 [Ascosphaera acerosa]